MSHLVPQTHDSTLKIHGTARLGIRPWKPTAKLRYYIGCRANILSILFVTGNRTKLCCSTSLTIQSCTVTNLVRLIQSVSLMKIIKYIYSNSIYIYIYPIMHFSNCRQIWFSELSLYFLFNSHVFNSQQVLSNVYLFHHKKLEIW